MPVVVYKGIVKELGPGISDVTDRHASTDYAYIEFTDGRILRNLAVIGGLDGKLTNAVEEDGEVDLHVLEGGKRANVLLAIKATDGRIFANDMSEGRFSMYALVVSLVVLGVGLIPFLGLGFVFLWFAWKTWSGLKLVLRAGEHVRALPNVVMV